MSEYIPSPSAHRRIWSQFESKEYRHGYAEGHTGDFLASQLHAMRTARGWNQSELAQRASATQPQISGWENSCQGVRLSSLHKIAEAFDVALVVKFVPFSQLAREAIGTRADVNVPSFDDDSSEAIRHSTVLVRMEPPARRSGRKNGDENPYVSHREVTGSPQARAL